MLFATLAVALGFMSAPIAQSDPERSALFQWFDSLALSRLDGQFIEIDSESGGDQPRSSYGFLIRSDSTSFRVLQLSLVETTYPRVKSDPREHVTNSYRKADLRTWLTEQQKKWANRYVESTADGAYRFGFYADAEESTLAYVAHRRGFSDLASGFYGMAEKAKDLLSPGSGTARRSFPDQVKADLAQTLVYLELPKLQDPTIPRAELLTDFDWIVGHFPDSDPRQKAAAYAAVLRPMVAEDASRTPLTDAQLKALDPAAQAQELVWQLRNQVGNQWTIPGRPDVLTRPGGGSSTPADKLVALGTTAVPALLDAWHDPRYMRVVSATGYFPGVGEPLTIGDGAREVLEHIASRSFRGTQAEAQARTWWAEVQKRGPRAVLIAEVESGSNWEAARRLAHEDPTHAFEPILAGFHAAHGNNPALYLQALGSLEDPRVANVLTESMRHGYDIEVRYAAAKLVARSHPEEAVNAMISELPSLEGGSPAKAQVLRYLLESGRSRAVASVAHAMPNLPVRAKLSALQSIPASPADHRFEFMGPSPSIRESALYDRQLESMLASLLRDRSRELGGMMSGKNYWLLDPQVCDLAAAKLAELWPSKYSYREEPSPEFRDQQCTADLNVWLRSQGLATIPLQTTRTRPAMPASLKAILATLPLRSDEQVAAEIPTLESYAIAALPGVLEAAKTVKSSAARKQLDALAIRLSGIVRSVTVSGTPPMGSSLVAAARGLKGKILTGDEYANLIRHALSEWKPNQRGFTLRADRDSDGLGVDLALDYGPQDSLQPSADRVSYGWTAMSGRLTLAGESGSAMVSSFLSQNLASIRAILDRCLAADPLVTFTARMRLTGPGAQ